MTRREEHGRQVLAVWSVGSAPSMTPDAKPIVNPPSVAVSSRFDAADDDADEHVDHVVQREVALDVRRVLDGEHDGDVGGEQRREEHGEADHAVGADAEQAGGRKSVAAARIWRPTVVRPSRRASARAQTAATTIADDRDLADVDAADGDRR